MSFIERPGFKRGRRRQVFPMHVSRLRRQARQATLLPHLRSDSVNSLAATHALERLCVRCGNQAEHEIALDARCPTCEAQFAEEAPPGLWTYVRAAPVAGAIAIVLGLLGLALGASVGGDGIITGPIVGMVLGAAVGGSGFRATLKARRRQRFLCGAKMPVARLTEASEDV